MLDRSAESQSEKWMTSKAYQNLLTVYLLGTLQLPLILIGCYLLLLCHPWSSARNTAQIRNGQILPSTCMLINQNNLSYTIT